MENVVTAETGHEVVLWCEDHSHDRPVRIVGLRRVADGTTRENGYVHRFPRVWVHDADDRQMGRGGRFDPQSGLYAWYDQPAAGRVVQQIDERGLRLRCPKCRKQRPLTWEKLVPLLEQVAGHGVSRLTLQSVAAILR